MKKILIAAPIVAAVIFFGISFDGNTAGKKVQICHHTSSVTNPYVMIEVSENAVMAHMKHGDIIADLDGDGFTAEFGPLNPCGIGDGTDCNDNNPLVFPRNGNCLIIDQ